MNKNDINHPSGWLGPTNEIAEGFPLIGISRHRISRDGAGVTTLVGFHGCPLRCKYCLNPQSLQQDGIWKSLSVEEIFKVVSKDDLYFRATGGGITFGGGEPLLAYKAILDFKQLCIAYGKNWKVNIETSLNVPNELVKKMIKIVDLWIVDIKDMNPTIYKAYTGKGNEQVIRNLKYLVSTNANITVRVPLIPEYNTKSDVEKSVELLHHMGITDIEKFTYITKIDKKWKKVNEYVKH